MLRWCTLMLLGMSCLGYAQAVEWVDVSAGTFLMGSTQQQIEQGYHIPPVVLVNLADAQAYAKWLSQKTGRHLLLPTEQQWEKSMRGDKGLLYPWGNDYRAVLLNNADNEPVATMAVGSFPQGASPYGVLDGAGQIFEWTADTAAGRAIVKGGSWDDYGGVCRPAAKHTRPVALKHILIGFRLVEMENDAT